MHGESFTGFGTRGLNRTGTVLPPRDFKIHTTVFGDCQRMGVSRERPGSDRVTDRHERLQNAGEDPLGRRQVFKDVYSFPSGTLKR